MIRLFVICLLTFSVLGNENYLKINQNIEKIMNGDNSPLPELYQISLQTDAQIQKELVRVIALSMLNLKSVKFNDYIAAIVKKEQGHELIAFLETPPFKDFCGGCNGNGKSLTDCNKCVDGVCSNCKGEGVIVYGNGKSRTERECTICKKSGGCQTCSGSGKLSSNCLSCRGSGAVLNTKIIPNELHKSLKVVLNKSAFLAGKEYDKEQLQNKEVTIAEREKFQAALALKKEQWEESEKKRLSTVKKKSGGKNGSQVTEEAVNETYVEGGSTKTLDNICLEIGNYLKNQEAKSKQSVLESCYGQFLSDIPTVNVKVSNAFINSTYDYKMRSGDGFYRFSLLRAQNNGYAHIDFKLWSPDGKQIGGVKNGNFWVEK